MARRATNTAGPHIKLQYTLAIHCLLSHVSDAASNVLQALKSMVEQMWHKDPEKRPTFPEVVQILDENMQRVLRTNNGSNKAAGHQCCSIQ